MPIMNIMPELANKRHEFFVKSLANPESDTFLNQSKSYQIVYKDSNGSSQPQSSRLLSNDIVKDRFLELMESYGLHDDGASCVHSEILYHGEEGNRIKALRMYHELKGRLSNVKSAGSGINLAMQLNITVSPSQDKPLIDVSPIDISTNEQ